MVSFTFTDPRPYISLAKTLPANAVARQDNLEFLEDVVPKTIPYKNVKASAQATQARLRGDNKIADDNNRPLTAQSQLATNGGGPSLVNGDLTHGTPSRAAAEEDPNSQLEMEMRQAQSHHDEDVQMIG